MQESSVPISEDGKSINSFDRQIIRTGLQQIGYSDQMIASDIRFVGEHGKPYQADMVAYSSSLRQDTDTAVISIKGTENAEKVQYVEVSPFMALATPVVVLAEYRAIHGMDEPRVRTVGLSKDDKTFNQRGRGDNIVPLSRFQEYLKNNREQFTPRILEMAKRAPTFIQLTLFDIAPDLMDKAIKIAEKELIVRFQQGIRKILGTASEANKQSVIHASLSFLGARILRDRLKENWSLTSGAAEFLNQAEHFLPAYFKVPPSIALMLDPLLDRLHSAFDFSQVTLDMVGKFYASAFVTKEVRDKWGIHYTKSLLARTLLERMPIEELPPDNRILGDPTCGSGSLLVAGYERLAKAAYLRIPQEERHNKLVHSIFGNDKDEFAAKIARMTLMLFHPPHKNNWKVTDLDAEDGGFGKKWMRRIGVKPTIIVANPPFGGKGGRKSQSHVARTRNQRDRSALILNHCLDILPDGGLLGIILTGTILNQEGEKTTRDRVLKGCQILEQWSIPAKEWFDGVGRDALAWVIRKSAPPLKSVSFFHLSNVPIPGRDVQLQVTMPIDVDNPPDTLVPSIFDDLLNKMGMSPNRLADHYLILNGLQAYSAKVTREESPNAHPWSGKEVRGTNPYSDFSDGRQGWLELIDSNFPKKSQRKDLRECLDQNRPLVMLRANRNFPLDEYMWSSIALIDIPEGSRRVMAPQNNFHATFSKKNDRTSQENDIYALWAILNHSLASLWFHECSRGSWINITKCRNFPLPRDWDVDKVQVLASMAKELIQKIRKGLRLFMAKMDLDTIKYIKTLINNLDDSIYHMYGITEKERHRIEEWFTGGEPRPGLEKYGERLTVKNVVAKSDISHSITYEEPEWETTCETLELRAKEQQIRLAVDGLRDCPEEMESDEEGIWLKILPVMPGWLLKEGAVSWIALTTSSAKSLKESPEKYISGFHLPKNAYKSQDEIDQDLFSIS